MKSPESEHDAIHFAPINSGLGFHPFSEGLPYAPVAPTRKPVPMTGAGAVSAGPARFVFPKEILITEANPAPALKTEAAPEDFGADYLGRRITAFVLDSFLNLSLCGIGIAVSIFTQAISLDALFSSGFLALLLPFLALLNWSLITAQEVAFGTTIGKRTVGLELRDASAPRIFLRAVLFIASAGLCGIGIFSALGDSQRRCWHDRLSGVQPLAL